MKKLHLEKWHEKHAKMTVFAGWNMPVWYEGISQEHMAVREHIGLFDVSHMGEIIFKGKDALSFLQWTTTNDISRPPPVSGTYTLVLNERGAVKDETLVYNMGNDTYMMVCDAVAVEKLYCYFTALKATIYKYGDIDLQIEDRTAVTELYSIQGPYAKKLCSDMFGVDLDSMWWFQAKPVGYDGHEIILSKSGYTGETGFELFFDNTEIDFLKLWEEILEMGRTYGIKPCGIAARDTLRIEAGYTLYGNETRERQLLSTDIDSVTPLEAQMDFAISYEKDFIGKDALEKQKSEGIPTKIVHLKLKDRSIPREGDAIFCNGRKAGEITSGTKSIVINVPVAIGFVENGCEGPYEVVVRNKRHEAKAIVPPFYNTKRYGANREVGI